MHETAAQSIFTFASMLGRDVQLRISSVDRIRWGWVKASCLCELFGFASERIVSLALPTACLQALDKTKVQPLASHVGAD
jgi:hypothetical protein